MSKKKFFKSQIVAYKEVAIITCEKYVYFYIILHKYDIILHLSNYLCCFLKNSKHTPCWSITENFNVLLRTFVANKRKLQYIVTFSYTYFWQKLPKIPVASNHVTVGVTIETICSSAKLFTSPPGCQDFLRHKDNIATLTHVLRLLGLSVALLVEPRHILIKLDHNRA